MKEEEHSMDIEGFKTSIAGGSPPDDLSIALQALWQDARAVSYTHLTLPTKA